MKKGLTELVMILDRSGSMSGLEKDTIGGFNSMIERQKKNEGEVLVSTVLFDDYSEVIYDRVDIKRIGMPEKKMFPRRPFSSSLQMVWKMQAADILMKKFAD